MKTWRLTCLEAINKASCLDIGQRVELPKVISLLIRIAFKNMRLSNLYCGWIVVRVIYCTNEIWISD